MPAAVLLALALLSPALAFARGPQDDARARAAIVQQSVAAYLATGRPCACPYSTMRNGGACGARSAYSRPGGAVPLCYLTDVTPGALADWYAQRR